MPKLAKGETAIEWIESTGQFWLTYRGGKDIYVASWEGHNQETARNIVDLLRAYLLTRGVDVPEWPERDAERVRLVVGSSEPLPEQGEYAHPRPWLRFQHDNHDFSLLAFGAEVAHVEAEEADFDFILRAVNSFDAANALAEAVERHHGTSGIFHDVAEAAIAYRKASEEPTSE